MLTKGKEEKRPEIHRVQFHEGVEYKGKQKRPVLIHSKMFGEYGIKQRGF